MIYRYGPLAWFWRALVCAALVASTGLLYFAVSLADVSLALVALPLAGPALVIPWMVAVRVERTGEEEIVVTNLLGFRRRLTRDALGAARIRRVAHGAVPTVQGPRAWVPVRSGLPLFLDLYGTVADPGAFRFFFGISRLPRR